MKRAMDVDVLPADAAAIALLLVAVDPHGLGGVVLRGLPGPARDRWLATLRRLLPDGTPWLKLPVNVSDDRLLGGLDFAATVGGGRPVYATGILESADGGVLMLSMAERLRPSVAAIAGIALDRGELQLERDGATRSCTSRFAVLAFDEGIEDDERLADSLADRLAFRVDLADLEVARFGTGRFGPEDIAAARRRLRDVSVADPIYEALAGTALAFGIQSARAALLSLRAARALTALLRGDAVTQVEAATAARLVFAQRAHCLPQPEQRDEESLEQQAEQPQGDDSSQSPGPSAMPDDVMVDAVQAAIPAGLLEMMQQSTGRRCAAGGRRGARAVSRRRGRPVGVRKADAIVGERLNILATLKAAAPWQAIRRSDGRRGPAVLQVRRQDLRVTRFQDNVETTTVFVVDASGSQAAQRLAEAKGAIELLLHDCYVRRDQVALIAFRGSGAEILLSPTRALARAKRSLAALPGGGGTPLAAGIDAARELAQSIARHDRLPAIVLMTDGRANIARDGKQGAEQAEQDALAAARLLRRDGVGALLVDTSRRPRPRARALADAMGASYVALPHADARTLSAAVQRSVA